MRARRRLPIEAIDPDDPLERVRTYVPEREIEGGLSIVLLAQRQLSGQEQADMDELMLGRVALKLASKPKEIDLLVREADILRKLKARQGQNSRIVRIGAGGKVLRSTRHDALIELEYLDGRTLAQWFEEEWRAGEQDDLTVAETAVDITRQLAEALDELADVEKEVVIHRDIKPENIMLTSTGLRLFDFNVARVDERGPKTEYVGTPRYMAPEVRWGESYDERADLYSLGLIFYELLTRELFKTPPHMLKEALPQQWDHARLPSLPAAVHDIISEIVQNLVTLRDWRMPSAAQALERLRALQDALRAHRQLLRRDPLEGIDLIQLVAELRPSGDHAVVADGRDMSKVEQFMRERLRVDDPLETWLVERIRKSVDSGARPLLIVLAGNAGDGKSHLIDRLINHHLAATPALRDKVTYIADATHADSPTQSQQERLEQFFAAFATGGSASAHPVSLIAMNTGMVIRFFERAAAAASVGDLEPLYKAMRVRLGLSRGSEPELGFDLEVVNLDLRDLLRPGNDGTSFFERMLDRLDPMTPGTLLHDKWSACERCPARSMCPVHFNLEALRLERVRKALLSIVERAALDPEVHLSPRLLWSFLYRIITGGMERYDVQSEDGEEGPCDVVRRRIKEHDWMLSGHFTEVLFAEEGRPDVPFWHALAEVDPAFSPAPKLDRLQTRLSLQKYRDDSDQEIETLGGKDGVLAGLHLRELLSSMHDEQLPLLSRRREAAVRRRVFFDSESLKSFSQWGAHREFRILLDAYEQYSARDGRGLSDEHKQALQDLSSMVSSVFLRGCGRTIGNRRFLRVSQPHPMSESVLLVEVERQALSKLFKLNDMVQPDSHILAHRSHAKLLEHLCYRPSLVTLSLVGNRLLVDLELYEFLLQVQDGRQPSKRDLAQFEALFFIGEQIGNRLAAPTEAEPEPLYILDENTAALYKLHLNGFNEPTLDREDQ